MSLTSPLIDQALSLQTRHGVSAWDPILGTWIFSLNRKCQRKRTVDRLNPRASVTPLLNQQTLRRLVFVRSSRMITAGLPGIRSQWQAPMELPPSHKAFARLQANAPDEVTEMRI